MKAILNFLFPRRCVGCQKFGSYICANCFATLEFYSDLVCPVCIKPSIDGATHPRCVNSSTMDGFLAGVVYKRLVKKLIYSWKYEPFVSDLTEAMADLLYESLIQQEAFTILIQQNPIITCVPLAAKKYRTRGYNHAALLGKALSQKLHLEFIEHLLVRTRNTKAQFALDKLERYENVKNAFALNTQAKEFVKGKTIILVDDVATTFSTLKFCTKALKKESAKSVWGVTFTREQ